MTTTKAPTIGELLRSARLDKEMSISAAHRELGVARQTYYHWEDDYAVPALERAADIAHFCDVPVTEVVNDILRRKGIPSYDDYLRQKSVSDSATLRRRHSGSIPGYVSWGGVDPAPARGKSRKMKGGILHPPDHLPPQGEGWEVA